MMFYCDPSYPNPNGRGRTELTPLQKVGVHTAETLTEANHWHVFEVVEVDSACEGESA